ncbi:hypothetical protein JG688_00015844, partial [Phytophthora aleatoria]
NAIYEAVATINDRDLRCRVTAARLPIVAPTTRRRICTSRELPKMPAPTRIWWFARTLQLAYSKELHIHFKVVAAVHLHVVVHTIPDRTNVSLTQKIAELSKLPDIVPTKGPRAH